MDHQEESQSNLWQKAVFGRQVEDFLSSDIGRFLLEKAEKDWGIAVTKLRDCKPEDLYSIQADMKRAESIRFWLASAVEEGVRALNLIDSENSGEDYENE